MTETNIQVIGDLEEKREMRQKKIFAEIMAKHFCQTYETYGSTYSKCLRTTVRINMKKIHTWEYHRSTAKKNSERKILIQDLQLTIQQK